MTRPSRCAIIRFSARWFPSAERRTNEEQPGLARESRGFLRRGSRLRPLLLSAGDARAGGVSVALFTVPRYSGVERFGEPVQGLSGDRAAAGRLFRPAGRQSGVLPLALHAGVPLAAWPWAI